MHIQFLWLGLLLAAAPHVFPAQVTPKDRTVIVISIDGFPAYAWQDPRLPMPNLRRLAREGVLAEGMTPPNPSVTWPSHTTMITGVNPSRHGVLYNGMPAATPAGKPMRVEQWVAKEKLVLFPTLYDKLFEAGFTTAEVNWVAVFQAKTITWSFPEIPVVTGAVEKEMIGEGLLTSEDATSFFRSSPVWRDDRWTDAAVHILKRHRPNLLLYHLLNVDALNHTAGPKSYASSTAYAQADAHIGRLLSALRKSEMEKNTTIFVVSDHGFKHAGKTVRLNAVLREKGIVRGFGDKRECDAWFLPGGGSAILYITNLAKKAALLPRLKAMMEAHEGVGRVFDAPEFKALGLPAPGGRMGDLYITAADGYAFSGADEGATIAPSWDGGYPGHHGYLNSDPDLRSTFLAWGAGVRKGARIATVNALDVAPTVAKLFGLSLDGIEGKVMKGVLD